MSSLVARDSYVVKMVKEHEAKTEGDPYVVTSGEGQLRGEDGGAARGQDGGEPLCRH